MSHVLHVERRRKELFGANHLRESILTTVMGWFLGCFGRNKERVRALQTRDSVHRRSKFSYGYQPPYKQHSPLRLGSRLTLREDSDIEHTAKSGESSCNGNIASERLPEEQFKQSYLSRVSELEEELAKLRSKLAEEAKEAQKLREEVKNLHSRGVLQTPDESRKVCVRDSEDEVSPGKWHAWSGPIIKIKLHPDTATKSQRAVCHVQGEKETLCRKATTTEISAVSQINNAQSNKAAKVGATTIADTQNHRSDKGSKILSPCSSCKSGSVQDVMLRTWHQAQLAEKKCLQQALPQDTSVAGEGSLKTPSNTSIKTEEEGVHTQAVNGTVACPSFLSSAPDLATYENKNPATSQLNLIKIPSEKKQVIAVNPSIENDKSTEIPRMMTIEEEKQATQSAATVQQLSFSTQAWGLRSLWRQPLSPVHETDSVVSSEGDSSRHSACSSGLSNKDCTEALKEIQRKCPDYLDQSNGLPGNLIFSNDRCFKERRSIMQLTSESGNQNTPSKSFVSDELISSSVVFDTCDDTVLDTAPIQCLSPQISPMCKKGSKRNRMAKEANSKRISVLPVSLTSSPPSDAGKENVSGIQNASASKEKVVNSCTASEVQVKSTLSVLKPVENLSEWRKLKQSTSELCVDQSFSLYHHEQEILKSRNQFLYNDSEKSFTRHGSNESLVIGNHLIDGQLVSTMWDLTTTGNGNVDLDESGQVNRRILSCMDLRSYDRYSEYGVDLSPLDFESSSAQLNEDTADTATSQIFEKFEAACVANREDLEMVTEANEGSGFVESTTCMSAESAIRASPCTSRKLNHLRHGLQNSPSERPILGAVAAHWVNPESAEPQWDGKGIPNSTTKYKEDQKVSWHTTPFEIRLERALATEIEVPQRNLLRWMD